MTAVLICGQVRNYWYTLPYTLDNIIKPNNCDVYCLVENGQWTPKGYKKSDPLILKDHIFEILGDHIKYFAYESDFLDIESNVKKYSESLNPDNQDINRFNIISQWTTKKKLFEIVEQTGFKYDTILFLRPDVYYEKVIIPKCSSRDIFLTTRCGSISCPWMMDNFYFGSFDAMKVVSKFVEAYSHLGYLDCQRCHGFDQTYRFVMEVQFGLYILASRLTVRYISYDIPSRRGERIPPAHPKSVNKLKLKYPLKYVIDQIHI